MLYENTLAAEYASGRSVFASPFRSRAGRRHPLPRSLPTLRSPGRLLPQRARSGLCARRRPQPGRGDLISLCELLNGVLRELQLHAGYAKELKIELARVQPYRQVEAYTDFLLATAWHCEPGETIAAMTPCMPNSMAISAPSWRRPS